MRLVIQRVKQASVRAELRTAGEIGAGLLVLIGVHASDTEAQARQLAQKTADLRIFSDDLGRFNLSLKDVGGAVLVVSQFTLFADARRGRRPSFSEAARPEVARPLIDLYCSLLRAEGLEVESGVFGASMEVTLVNDGPVTLFVDSDDLERPRRSQP